MQNRSSLTDGAKYHIVIMVADGAFSNALVKKFEVRFCCSFAHIFHVLWNKRNSRTVAAVDDVIKHGTASRSIMKYVELVELLIEVALVEHQKLSNEMYLDWVSKFYIEIWIRID